MIKHKHILFVLIAVLITVPTKAQQVLDPANYITVDNLFDNVTGGNVPGTNLCNDTVYCEIPPLAGTQYQTDGWFTNVGATWYGGYHRRTPNTAGSPNGASATYYFNVPVTDIYLVYHYMGFTGNATTNAYVTLKRFGEGVVADSFRYNIQSNNVSGPTLPSTGSWMPLAAINVPAADKGLEVRIGADTLTPAFMRVDAVRILRSPGPGPDLEFGRRHMTQFDSVRMPEVFPQTTFKWDQYSEKKIPVWNIGDTTLIITDVTFGTNRFSNRTPLPMVLQPGEKGELTIRFSPKGEEVTRDTMIIHSNDPYEPQAYLTVIGEGINYNFIMNASQGDEPHWNVPPGPATYVETGTTSWLNSVISPFIYPIPGGNRYSRVYTAVDLEGTATYGFNIPDTLAGKYILEYSGPAGSPNAATSAKISVVTPFIADTQIVTGFNQRQVTTANIWAKIQDNQTRIFELNGGGTTYVKFENPAQASGNFIRTDLLRVRLLPIAPTASTSADATNRILSFGSVSIYDSVRQAEFNYQRGLQIRSNGETPLVVDSIMIVGADSIYFRIENMPPQPLVLPAIDGVYNMTISFLPDSIRLHTATLRMWTNDTLNNRYINITLSGQGVGTNIIVDDSDPTTYVSTPIVDWNPNNITNINYWQRITGSGTNNNRLITYIYGSQYNGTPNDPLRFIQWFPRFPSKPGRPPIEPDSFDVWAVVPAGSSTGNPRAVYEINHTGGTTIVKKNQNSTAYGGDVPANGRIYLGRYVFLRGGQDIYGGGTIFGNIRLINDHNEVNIYYQDSVVNTALRDSFVTRADAIILQEASDQVGVVDPNIIPNEYFLSQNFPNPFNPSTIIRFGLPVAEKVTLKVYDVLGREIKTLVNDEMKPGYHSVEWDGTNNYGARVSSGIYIYRLVAGKYVKTMKMMMVK